MFAKATEIAPDDHRGWGRLANSLAEIEEEYDRAMEMYSLAVKLAKKKLEVNPTSWGTLGHLAVYLAALGDSEEAEITAQRALQLSDHHALALFRASEVYYRIGNLDACLSMLEKMVSKDPTYRQFVNADDPVLKDLERFQALLAQP